MTAPHASATPSMHTRGRGSLLRLLVLVSLLCGLVVAAPVTAAGAAAAIPTPVTTGVPRFEAGACKYQLGSGIEEGKAVVCGDVVVPEKHANPGGKTIRLNVALYKARSATPAPEPIVMLSGGPGQSDQVFATVLSADSPVYKSATANNDVILFDQRGTGKSQPALICTELLNATTRNFTYLSAFADSLFVTLANRCRDRLVGAGIDLTAYTTSENAADVNDVRQALGYTKVNLFGASYGSELGLAVARDFPQIVRTNNLGSIVPPQVPYIYDPPQSFNRALTALFADCAADAACNAANPNLQAVYQSTVARMNRTPAIVTLKDPGSGQTLDVPISGDLFTSLLFNLFYSTSALPFVPDMITRTARNDTAWLATLLPLLLATDPDDPMASGMQFSVVCSKSQSPDILARALEADKGILPEVRSAIEPQFTDFYTICEHWPSRNVDAKGAAPAKSDAPTTLISGQFDPITPPSYAAIAKETLPNATSVTLPGGGHSAIIPFEPIGACGYTIMLTQIIDASKAPDTSCVAKLKITYQPLPAALGGGPAASSSPSPSASARPSPVESPTPRPTPPLPTPPATGNGGYLPGLPNTGSGGGPSGHLPLGLVLLPLLALGVGARLMARRR